MVDDSSLKIIRLVIASPNDVNIERGLVDEIVSELNKGLALELRFMIKVLRWETDAHPGFHTEGPRGLIDSVLSIEDCDLIVGIFWKRFGTSVKDGTSGTEHEFRTAYKSWKKNGKPQIMVYFKQKPYAPESKNELEQWSQVLEFRENFPKEGMWCKYTDEQEFEQIFRDHVTLFLRNLSKKLSSNVESKEYQLLPSIIQDVQKVIKIFTTQIGSFRVNSKSGGQELFRLYESVQNLTLSSKKFIEVLDNKDIKHKTNELVQNHNELINDFADFTTTASKCAYQLRIFNSGIHTSIQDLFGMKHQRIFYWLEVFKAASFNISDSKALAKLNLVLSSNNYTKFFHHEPVIVLQNLISLNDHVAVKKAVNEGKHRIRELESLTVLLEDFIKQNYEFADLFQQSQEEH